MSDKATNLALQSTLTASQRAGFSVGHLWRLVKAGRFPQPIRVGGRTLFRSDEISEWIEAETAAFRASQPSRQQESDLS